MSSLQPFFQLGQGRQSDTGWRRGAEARIQDNRTWASSRIAEFVGEDADVQFMDWFSPPPSKTGTCYGLPNLTVGPKWALLTDSTESTLERLLRDTKSAPAACNVVRVIDVANTDGNETNPRRHFGFFTKPWPASSSFPARRLLEAIFGKSEVESASEQSWKLHVLDEHASADVDVLTATADAAVAFVLEHGPASMDLRELPSDSVSPEHLAMLLRAVSSWRDEVPGWRSALSIAEAKLREARLDPDDALFGLR